jgi:hypothetical protein
MIMYDFFARIYHWTPEQVRGLSMEEMEWLPLLEAARQAAQEDIGKIEEAKARHNM